MDLAAELKKIRLFKDLSDGQLDKLAPVCREHSLSPGDVLCREGESGEEMYVVVMGTVRIDKKARGASEEIARLGAGSYVGEAAMLPDAPERLATGTAIEKTFVIGLARKDVDELVTADPDLGRALYRAIAQSLTRRVNLFAGEVAHYRAMAQQHE